ncbi:hypothetical protein D1007_43519 [Hordeum vulgare]|nr:hypothetical protein D1007_43519 [Hordeum vulgare]
MASGSSSKKTLSHGAWVGSEICDGHIEVLYHRRMLPPAFLVTVRILDAETAPTPQEGEIVVFHEHFYMGFRLPASTFFSNCLIFFVLQPHHLAPNAVLQLSSFVVMCEGFLGIEPRLDLWQSLFFLKQQSKKTDKAELEKLDGPRPMTPCGAAQVHHRSKSGFPQMPLQESIKQWHRGFFYVKNASPAHDTLNMPPFDIEPPTARLNWHVKYPKPIPEVAQIGAYLDSLKGRGLLGHDLLTTMISRKILPLQRRPHLPDGRPMFENLHALNLHAPDVVTFDASEIEDEGMIESRSAASEVDLEEIPESSEAEAVVDAPELNLYPPEAAMGAPEVVMDASDAANPPPAAETAPAGTSAEPAAMPTPGDGTIVVSNRGPAAPGSGPRVGSRPTKTWRAANLERQMLPAGTILEGVPELVSLFANNRYKVEQAARVAGSNLERLEERTRVQAYNTMRAQNHAADGQVAELQGRVGEVVMEWDALHEVDGRLQQQLTLL